MTGPYFVDTSVLLYAEDNDQAAKRDRARALVGQPIAWLRDRDRYLTALRSYQDGYLESWIELGATSIVVAVDWVAETSSRITELLGELEERSGTRGASVAARIVSDLASYPLVDATTVAARYQVTKQAANQALSRLRSRGVLTEFGFSRKVKPVGRPRKDFTSRGLMSLLVELGS